MGDSLPSNVRVSSSFDGLVSDLAAFVSQAADRAVAARGRFLLGLSGGSLPSTLSAALESAIESGKELHMDKWHVFYVDERVVPLDHKDSNHGACTAAIFGKPWCKIPITQVYTIKPELPLREVAIDYEKQVGHVFGGHLRGSSAPPSFDLLFLGMGPDGHTASLFPDETRRLVAEIADSPKPPPLRVTFTLPLINQAHEVAFVVTGKEKAGALVQVFDASTTVPLPSARVRMRGTHHPLWFMDDDAASELQRAFPQP